MGFRLIAISMTLNDLERRNSPYFAFFAEFECFADLVRHSDYRQTYNVHKVLYLSSSLPLLAITDPPCSVVSLRQLSYLLVYCLETNRSDSNGVESMRVRSPRTFGSSLEKYSSCTLVSSMRRAALAERHSLPRTRLVRVRVAQI